MPTKTAILDSLGETALLLPSAVQRALVANDRAKFLLTLLQSARLRAEHPELGVPDLAAERLAAGVDDAALGIDLEGCHTAAEGDFQLPGACAAHTELVAAIEVMLDPLEVPAGADDADTGGRLRRRLETILGNLSAPVDDVVPLGYVDAVSSASRDAGDSLHLVIMDAHKELNRLEQRLATESVNGAAAFGLTDADRPVVAAFMRGVHATSRLRMDHPGLGTTATRVGPRLVIQNDIGTTDAHVLVVHVEGLTTTVHYTDVHGERLRFLQRVLDGWGVEWSASRAGRTEGMEAYEACTGTFRAADDPSRNAFLEHLGSRLTFLIDWNRARKRLATLVGGRNAIDLLAWAAEQGVGHMPWLHAGGDRLVFDAVEMGARIPVRYGQPLREVLGAGEAIELVRHSLRAATDGMLAGRSPLLIRDQLRVELLSRLHSVQQGALDLLADHACLVVEAAMALRDALLAGSLDDPGAADRLALRARGWEHAADELVTQIRELGRRSPGGRSYAGLASIADDAIDALEDSAFNLSLVAAGSVGAPVAAQLERLAGVAAEAAREHVKVVEAAREVDRAGMGEDLQDLLDATSRVVALEHDADDALRALRTLAIREVADVRQLLLVVDMARSLEQSTDALRRSAVILNDQILEERRQR
jgi:uncharacterized protein Yka (UPF0111/DUF47 family)